MERIKMFLFGGRKKIIRCPLNFVMRKRKISDTSMTESYDPYANAVAERVNGI